MTRKLRQVPIQVPGDVPAPGGLDDSTPAPETSTPAPLPGNSTPVQSSPGPSQGEDGGDNGPFIDWLNNTKPSKQDVVGQIMLCNDSVYKANITNDSFVGVLGNETVRGQLNGTFSQESYSTGVNVPAINASRFSGTLNIGNSTLICGAATPPPQVDNGPALSDGGIAGVTIGAAAFVGAAGSAFYSYLTNGVVRRALGGSSVGRLERSGIETTNRPSPQKGPGHSPEKGSAEGVGPAAVREV